MSYILRNALLLLFAFCMMCALILMFIDPVHIVAECAIFCIYGAMAAVLLVHDRDRD